MSGKKLVFLEEEKPVLLPIWREALTPCDWGRLHASLVYYGVGVSRGDGSAVITVPGFLGHDLYLAEMNLWLKRIGYRSYASKIGRNADCPDILVDRLLLTVNRAFNETGKKVHLIGHSLGGILSRAAANFAPEQVQSVTTLGSPFLGIRSHPTVMMTSKTIRRQIHRRAHTRPAHKPMRQHCFSMSCNCPFAQAAKADVDESIYQTAIYTKSDGIVDWNVCLTGDPAVDFEVSGTHCGLAWNAEVYRIIAKRLPLAKRWEQRLQARSRRAVAPIPQAGALLA